MAPAKRGRPAFSPPRPRKAANTATSKPSTKSSAVKKSKMTSGAGTSASKTSTTSKPKSKAPEKTKRRSRLVSPTPSASDSLGAESAEEADDASTDEDDEAGNNTALTTRDATSSPEPDYMLVEVTHGSPSSAPTDPPIPLGLIHRILHSQFAEPEKTKISTDAREVVGKYIEVFVRESIMRCAYAKNGGGEGSGGGGGGWLEVEDLEKVAVQLCLDF